MILGGAIADQVLEVNITMYLHSPNGSGGPILWPGKRFPDHPLSRGASLGYLTLDKLSRIFTSCSW